MKTVVFIPIWELFMPERGQQDADLAILGRAVRRMREERGISADELADATDMTRQRIDVLETGHLDPTYELLLTLAEALGTQPSALVALAEQLKESSEPRGER
jgi:transcriptional regulator with XRE-family HTH domain